MSGSVQWHRRSPRSARVSPKQSPQPPDDRGRRAAVPQVATGTCRPPLMPVLRPQHPAMSRTLFEGFEAVQALGRGTIHLERLVPGYQSFGATPQDRARAVAAAITPLG